MSADATWDSFSAILLTVCWGAFVLAWAAGAIYNARRAPGVRERSTWGYHWVFAAGALFLVYGPVDWDWLTVSSPATRAAGVVVLVAATAFTLWARAALGTMWSSSVVAKAGHVLRTDGPYSITRHPIYTGMTGMLLGTALIEDLGRWAAVFVLAVAFFAWKARAEERLMSSIFPEYDSYRRRVPQLFPVPPRVGALLHR